MPAFCGKKTPVPHDLFPEPKKIACMPGPPVAACLGLSNDDLEVDFEYSIVDLGRRNYY